MKKQLTPVLRLFGFMLTLAIVATVILAACGGTDTTQPTASSAAPTLTPTVASTATSAPTPTVAPTPTPTLEPTATPTPKPLPPTQSPTQPPQPKVVQITIIAQGGKFAFSPASISIPKGTQVVWINKSQAPHTVTSNNQQFTSSGTFGINQSFATTFTTAGTFAYHCEIHPYMTATVTVTA